VMSITLMLVGSICIYEVDIILVDMMAVLVQPVLLQRLKPPMVLLALGLALPLLVLVLDMLLDLLLLCPCLSGVAGLTTGSTGENARYETSETTR